ncbi:MAG: nicotinate (nicotinamide) nucleotide adenylyltransferase [Ruminococcus sp.]
MNIALFGGAFNPIHKAHILLAERAMEEFDIDRTILMPTYISPHKNTTARVSYNHRMAMCRLASKDDSRFIVSDLESHIEGKSYSYKTLSILKEQYNDDNLFMIIGADMYMSLLSWKNPQQIFDLASIITCPRDNDDYNSLLEYSKVLKKEGCSSYILKEPIMQLSSTYIRENVSLASKQDFIDKSVYEYIEKNKLYGVK